MKSIRLTVGQLKEMRGLKNQVEANGIMNFLKDTGNAVPVGKQKHKGRGKPSIIYEIPQKVTIEMFEDSHERAVESTTEETNTNTELEGTEA